MHPGTNEEAVASPKAQAIVSERRFPRIVLPSKTLDSYLRIGIYRDMYLARLREALASDYPALMHYWGMRRLPDWSLAMFCGTPLGLSLDRLGDHLPEPHRSVAGLPAVISMTWHFGVGHEPGVRCGRAVRSHTKRAAVPAVPGEGSG
jgi:hypothetical protein